MADCITSILSSEEVIKFKQEGIRILTEVGAKVNHNKAKKMLEDAGAKVDHQTDLVKIPIEIIRKCLQMLPKNVVLAGREPEKDVTIKSGIKKTYARTCSGCEMYIDLYSGKYRKAELSDVKDWGVLVETLENIQICTAPYYAGTGLNLNARDVRAFELLQENISKHILMQVYGPQNLDFCIKLAVTEAGNEEELRRRPRFSAMMSPTSPLHFSKNTVSMMLLAGEYGIPIFICTMPICGASGPVTLAGSGLLAVAEYLASVVILQLAWPGAPIIFAPRPMPIDMARGSIVTGSVEGVMTEVASTQIAKEGFGWPVDVMGAFSDSFIVDSQCAIEHSFAMILNSCAGADIISGLGNLESGFTLSPAQLVINDEMMGMLFRATRGIDVNDETIGFEVINRIGPGVGKSYLDDEHTLKYFREEYYLPKLFIRSSRTNWQSEGSKNLYKRARERAINILKEHKPLPLEENIVKELRLISGKAEMEIKETYTI